ncbi:hypothetical protein KJI95_02625 [Shewanella sp. JM162201]|uniref:Uncharacterized protein n=1 Tax=Shewanella jiangmenensis TaxID=2837387 RepID=A0ABS5UZ29_9GAMM|nr:hypothetical protein [Shewanella jiangmenensis]MBT1443418.1 hypothetical protein [Shewanella jiangmenensis]
MDESGGDRYQERENIDIRLSVGLLYEDDEWESLLFVDPKAKKELEHQSGRRYWADGIVTSIDVDVRIRHLSAPIDSGDPRGVGEALHLPLIDLM